jgi:DNA helicase HerA-like ATPase
MPRDIPAGTLSQIGTFIVHRLINDKDKQVIENAASSAGKNALSFLPSLGEGEALLIGVDFQMPLLIKINKPKTPPTSETPDLKSKQQLIWRL